RSVYTRGLGDGTEWSCPRTSRLPPQPRGGQSPGLIVAPEWATGPVGAVRCLGPGVARQGGRGTRARQACRRPGPRDPLGTRDLLAAPHPGRTVTHSQGPRVAVERKGYEKAEDLTRPEELL